MACLAKEYTLDHQLCFSVYATAHAFARAYKPVLEEFGLTYPQYLVMLVLWEKDNLSVKTLGQKLGLNSGTLSPLLKRLEQADMIRRLRDQNDERLVRVSLTPKGDALQSEVNTIMRKMVGLTRCNVEELTILRETLNRLRHNLATAG